VFLPVRLEERIDLAALARATMSQSREQTVIADE
jgi:hypothetical protein